MTSFSRTGRKVDLIPMYAKSGVTPFADIQAKLSRGEISNFIENPGNAVMNFVAKDGRVYQSLVKYNRSTNQIFPPEGLVPFEQIAQGLANGEIVSFEENKNIDTFGNLPLIIVDTDGRIYYTVSSPQLGPPNIPPFPPIPPTLRDLYGSSYQEPIPSQVRQNRRRF